MGEEDDDGQVHAGGHTQREREALHPADGEEVEHDRGHEVDRVGDEDRTPGVLPPLVDRRPECPSLTHLVTDALEVDDEGVHRDADGDDEAGHARQGQAISHGRAQRGDDQVGAGRGHGQRGHGHHRQAAVLPGQVKDDEAEADEPGDQTVAQLLGPQRGGDLLLGLDREAQGQRAEGELVRQGVGLVLVEVTGDLDPAVGDRRVDVLVEPGGHDGQPVQDDGELGLVLVVLGLRVLSALGSGGTRLVAVGQQPLGQLGELLGAVGVEGQRDDPLVGGLPPGVGLQTRVGALELGAGDIGRAEDVGAVLLRARVLGAGDDGDLGVLRLTGEVLRIRAVGHVAVVEELLSDPGVRGVVLGRGGQRVGGDDAVLVHVRQLLGDLLGCPGLRRGLGRGLRGGGRRGGGLIALARALLGACRVLRRLGRLPAGARVGLSLGLGSGLARRGRGCRTGGVLAGDVLGGLLGAARQDAEDRPEVHDGGGPHQLQSGLAGLSG